MDPFLPNYVVMDARLVASFRKALVAWNPCEFGAPAIHPSTPLAIPVIEGTSGAAALDVFVRFGTLECGPRSFPNELRRAGPFSRWSHGIPDDWFDRDTIEIDVTADHLRLLRMLQVDDRAPNLAPGFDPKRPVADTNVVMDVWELFYGPDGEEDEETDDEKPTTFGADPSVAADGPEMSASSGGVDREGAIAVGGSLVEPQLPDHEFDGHSEFEDDGPWSFGEPDDLDDHGNEDLSGGREPTSEELARCRRLYMDMPAVLQVFLREAAIRPGVYGGIPVLNMWKWMEELPDWLEPRATPGA